MIKYFILLLTLNLIKLNKIYKDETYQKIYKENGSGIQDIHELSIGIMKELILVYCTRFSGVRRMWGGKDP